MRVEGPVGQPSVGHERIERVVDDVPGVLESAAVGVPDELRDEAIHVYVVARPGVGVDPDTVIAHCRRHLAKFKVPDAVYVVDELPRTSVGKIRKNLLRQPMHQVER
jgi:crotonobetaine/carnitine-CoA ligase